MGFPFFKGDIPECPNTHHCALPRTCFPILAAQAVNAFKFTQIAGHNNQAAAAGMAGNQQIIASDHLPCPFKRCANISRMIGGLRVKGKDIEPGGEPLHLVPIMLGPRRLGGSVQQLGQDDRRYAQTFRTLVKQLSQALGTIA